MIKENQKILNYIHVFTDGIVIFLSFPIAFWIRFEVFQGIISVPFENYVMLAAGYTIIQLFTYAAFGLYQSFRKSRLWKELLCLWEGTALDAVLLLGWLFLMRDIHYSRWTLAIAFSLILSSLSLKRLVLRVTLRRYRQKGYNLKHVIIVGSGTMAQRYLREIMTSRDLGYNPVGYVADRAEPDMAQIPLLGNCGRLDILLEWYRPDEVVAALEAGELSEIPLVIEACEKAGVRLSIIPFYASYMPSHPQFDDLNGILMLNMRRIPLDNWANAFLKRAVDILGASILLILCSPVMLLCAIAVKLSSPGPVIFSQKRVGMGKKSFHMYKFRSMRLNDTQETGWSSNQDSRKTRIGAFMRKCSLDELPQFWNVLRGDMSLVGPRPEVPYYVELFREEIPLYMVKHQVRPGITGWAQVHGYRGDTSVRARIEYDISYIENWSLWLDLQILVMTVFGGKFLNSEELVGGRR